MYTIEDSAWMKGFDAFQSKQLLSDNPYNIDKQNKLWKNWRKGWLVAKEEFYQQETDMHPSGLG